MDLDAEFAAAIAVTRAGQYAEAVARWRAIIAERPEMPGAQSNLVLALLGAGDYAEGFPAYDQRFTRNVGRVWKPQLSFAEWRGEPLAGKSILVWGEQGFGDQIMFARFVPELAKQAAQVSMLVRPGLGRLFAALPARVLEAQGQVSIPRHDYWIMAGSVPGRLGVTLETLPSAPYLPGKPGGTGVGLAWRGNPGHYTNADRSLPPELAEELLALPGVISLHPEDTGAKDLQDTAEIVQGLERVVSVCTSMAHLSGAMGKPVDVLLMAQDCDWRWMADRSDSPWYPSATLLRQPRPGDWRTVLDAVKARVTA
jgi:hypothetical protein